VILFDLLVILVGSANVLWLPANRRRRTVAFLAVLGCALVAANLLPDARVVPDVKGVVLVIYLAALLRFPHLLAGLSRRETEYDTRLRAILKTIRRAHSVWDRARKLPQGTNVAEARAGAPQAYATAQYTLTSISPPDEGWAHATELLRAYVVAADARARLPDEDAPSSGPLSDTAFNSMVEDLDRAWDRAMRVARS